MFAPGGNASNLYLRCGEIYRECTITRITPPTKFLLHHLHITLISAKNDTSLLSWPLLTDF